MPLWTFGDSFTSGSKDSRDWMGMLSADMGQYIYSNSIPGSSLAYCATIFEKNHRRINRKNDYVIVSLSSAHRNYLFERHPDLSQPHQFNNWWQQGPAIDQNAKAAIDEYYKHFSDINYRNNKIFMTSFLYRLDHFSSRLHNKVIVLPCFEDGLEVTAEHKKHLKNLIIPDRCLFEISLKEFAPDTYDEVYKKFIEGFDARANHFCFSNHKVLFSKLKNSMVNGSPLDLSEGFETAFVTLQSLDDQSFVQAELYDHYNQYKK